MTPSPSPPRSTCAASSSPRCPSSSGATRRRPCAASPPASVPPPAASPATSTPWPRPGSRPELAKGGEDGVLLDGGGEGHGAAVVGDGERGAGLLDHLVGVHVRRGLAEHQALVGDVDDGEVGDDPVDAGLAG